MLTKEQVKKLDKVFIHKVKNTRTGWCEEGGMDHLNNTWIAWKDIEPSEILHYVWVENGAWCIDYDCLFDHDPREAKEPNEKTKQAIKELEDVLNKPNEPLCGLELPVNPPPPMPECKPAKGSDVDKKHNHYFKECPYDYVDVYRILDLFTVTDPCLQHAVKKLLVTGGRGHKNIDTDVQDVIDTLVRWQDMRKEEQV